jgi:hypothetical protein
VQKIVKDGKVVGARVHLLVEPENYTSFRINVAPQAQVPNVPVGDNVARRQALSNAVRGFVIKTLKSRRKVTQNEIIETYVDIRYRDKL